MKYLKVLGYISKVAAIIAAILGFCKLLFVTCAALDPLFDAVFAWMVDMSGVFAAVIVIGMVVWVFGDVCDEQAREERKDKCSMF